MVYSKIFFKRNIFTNTSMDRTTNYVTYPFSSFIHLTFSPAKCNKNSTFKTSKIQKLSGRGALPPEPPTRALPLGTLLGG